MKEHNWNPFSDPDNDHNGKADYDFEGNDAEILDVVSSSKFIGEDEDSSPIDKNHTLKDTVAYSDKRVGGNREILSRKLAHLGRYLKAGLIILTVVAFVVVITFLLFKQIPVELLK